MWAALHPCLRRAGSPVDGLWPTRCEPCRHRTARFDRLGESGRLKIDRDDTLSDGSARDSATRRSRPRVETRPIDAGRASLETEPDDRVPRCGRKPAVYGGRGCHRVTVSLEDEAGNTERYEQIVSVDSETNESDDEPESVVGGGGGMGGGPTPATTELHSSSLSVSPSRPETGQAVTVSIELENTGDKIAHETISLQADGQTVVSEDVRLSSGATHEARLTHRFAAPGEYDLTVDSPSLGSLSAGTVTVTGDPIADSEDDSEQTGDESTVNETPGFGLVGAIVAVLGLGVLLGRRE